MEDNSQLKKNLLIVVFLLFFSFPFLYFLFLIQIRNSFLFDAPAAYPVIILTGLVFAYIIDRNIKHTLDQDTKRGLFITFTSAVILYTLYLLLMTWSRYLNYVSEVIDLQFFHQVIWQLSEFKLPYLWILDHPLYIQWSQHFSPIYFFIAPLYWFVKDAGLLFFLQAVAVVSGAIPVYLTAKKFLKSRSIGLALSFAYLAFGGLQFGFAYGFHEIMFFPPLFLWAYYFYLSKKVKSYYLFILLCLMVKEEVAFIIIFWSIYLLIVKKDRMSAIITGVLGLLWYFLCFHIIFPIFSTDGGFGYWGQYTSGGGSGLFGIAKFALLKPLQFLGTLVTPMDKVNTILQTFGSFSFLLFLFPPSLIIIFPSLMEKLLSSGIAMANGAHYSAAITAVTVVATFEAFPHFYKNNLLNKYICNKNIFFTILISYVALFSNVFFGYRGLSLIPLVHNTLRERGLTEDNSLLLNQIIRSIPDQATISTQSSVQPHIHKYYQKLADWPGCETADFIIIDTQIIPVLTTSEALNISLDKLAGNKDYQLVVNQSGIIVYRKKTFKMSDYTSPQ